LKWQKLQNVQKIKDVLGMTRADIWQSEGIPRARKKIREVS
jgi:hypothetical protein